MNESRAILYVILFGTITVLLILQLFRREERPWLLASWGMHIGAAFAQAWIYLYHYGYGDSLIYARTGVELGKLMHHGFLTFAPEVVRLFFHQEVRLPVVVPGVGGATGSMSALTGILSFLTGGGIYTCCVSFGLFACLGKFALYAAFRDEFRHSWKQVLIATTLVPSVIFWTSSPLKEAASMTGLGVALWGASCFIRGKGMRYLPAIVFGVLLIAYTKPYILIAGLVAMAALDVLRRLNRSRNVLAVPVLVVFGLVLTAGIVIALGELFERFAVDNLVDEAARLQGSSRTTTGGTDYSLGDPSERTLLGQLAFAPLALATALFRPFFFEVRGALPLLNAMETLVFALLFIRWLAQERSKVLKSLISEPWLGFSAAFTLVLGLGVGLSTTNLGTLSRYRMPLVPFFLLVLLIGPRLSKLRRRS